MSTQPDAAGDPSTPAAVSFMDQAAAAWAVMMLEDGVDVHDAKTRRVARLLLEDLIVCIEQVGPQHPKGSIGAVVTWAAIACTALGGEVHGLDILPTVNPDGN